MPNPTIIIVGAGFGGLLTARHLGGVDADVIVIDRNNHHLFQPLLYQVATAGLSPADIATPIRAILRAQKNVTILMDEVVGVDAQNQKVLLHTKTISYDYLVLATGSRYNYFGHDEWAQFAPSLKSISDATRIRRQILTVFEQAEIENDPEIRRELLTFILVGGGPTGVELAGAIAELARHALKSDFRKINPATARILLCEASARILSAFPEDLAEQAKKALMSLGVEVLLNAKVEAVDGTGALVSGKRIASRNIIWTAGVIASPVGKWLGIPTDRQGRVQVNPDLRTAQFPSVFVIGDAAASLDRNGQPLPAVAPVAMQQGKYVARRVIGLIEKKDVEPFRYIDKGNLATIGRSFAIAEFGRLKLSGLIAWFLWLVVHIFYLIGFRNRLVVLIQWAWAYLKYDPGARLIIPSEAAQKQFLIGW